LTPPQFIAYILLQNLLRKMFVFAIPVLIRVLRFHKLKIPKFGYYDSDRFCEP